MDIEQIQNPFEIHHLFDPQLGGQLSFYHQFKLVFSEHFKAQTIIYKIVNNQLVKQQNILSRLLFNGEGIFQIDSRNVIIINKGRFVFECIDLSNFLVIRQFQFTQGYFYKALKFPFHDKFIFVFNNNFNYQLAIFKKQQIQSIYNKAFIVDMKVDEYFFFMKTIRTAYICRAKNHKIIRYIKKKLQLFQAFQNYLIYYKKNSISVIKQSNFKLIGQYYLGHQPIDIQFIDILKLWVHLYNNRLEIYNNKMQLMKIEQLQTDHIPFKMFYINPDGLYIFYKIKI